MFGMDIIRHKYGGLLCRRCINEIYGASLKASDCHYPYPFKYRCPRCGEQRNIVGSFRFSGQMKVLLLKG